MSQRPLGELASINWSRLQSEIEDVTANTSAILREESDRGKGITLETRGNLIGKRLVSLFSEQLRSTVEASSRDLAHTQAVMAPKDLLDFILTRDYGTSPDFDSIYAGLIEMTHWNLMANPQAERDRAKQFAYGMYAGWVTLGPFGLDEVQLRLVFGDPDKELSPSAFVKPATARDLQDDSGGSNRLHSSCPYTGSSIRLSSYISRVFKEAENAGVRVQAKDSEVNPSHYPITDAVVASLFSNWCDSS